MRASLVTSLHDLLKPNNSGGVANVIVFSFFQILFLTKMTYYIVCIYKGDVIPFLQPVRSFFDISKVVMFSRKMLKMKNMIPGL